MQSIVLEDLDWGADALDAIVELAASRDSFTAVDLMQVVRPAPHSNMVGAAFSAARNLGFIEAAGYTTSSTPSRHHGVIRKWRRKERSEQ